MRPRRQLLQLMFLLQRLGDPTMAYKLAWIHHPSLFKDRICAKIARIRPIISTHKTRIRSTMVHSATTRQTESTFIYQASRRHFHSSTCLRLNRFLFDTNELDPQSILDEGGVPFVIIPREDYRTEHAAKILGLQNGDTLRAGIILDTEEVPENNHSSASMKYGGYTTDLAQIEWLPEGKNKQPCPTKNGEPPGSLKVVLHSLSTSPIVNIVPMDSLSSNDDFVPLTTPSVSLILALPRPLALSRLLPMIAQMGVKDLILISAQKVPRDYFGSHLFRKPHELRRLLVEGLCQAGDVRIPRIRVVQRLKPFLEDGDLDTLFPLDSYARVIAHPVRSDSIDSILPLRMSQVVFPKPSNKSVNIVLAVGPEGGWAEPYEIDLFKSFGFQQVTLGSRILRSDVAVISLLSLAHDVCDQIWHGNRESI